MNETPHEFFCGRAAGLGDDADAMIARGFIPAAAESFAGVAIGGDIGPVVGTTDDVIWPESYYRWYDPANVPRRGTVYRISCTGTVHEFTRRLDGDSHEAAGWEYRRTEREA